MLTVYASLPDVTIYHGDAELVLSGLDGGIVDAIVTSPPYADARLDYSHVGLDEYAAWARGWLAESRRVVASHGTLMLNLGRVFRGGEEQGYWIEALAAARAVGWLWLDTLVWSKPNANPIRGRVSTDGHEYVLVLGGPESAVFEDAVRTAYAPETLARMQRGWRRGTAVKGADKPQEGRRPNPLGARPRSVVEVYTGREKGNAHPAPMALELAEHLVRLSCAPGGTVLDPFGGSGTTGVAARRYGCAVVLVDVDEGYCAGMAERLSQLALSGAA